MKLPFEDDPHDGQEEKIQLFLGCANGLVFKYEKQGNEDWVKTGEFKGQATVTDVL